MSAPKLQAEHSALDPWTPPPADVEWFGDPVKRSNHLELLKKHNARLYADAAEFYIAYRAELDSADALKERWGNSRTFAVDVESGA